MPGGDPAGSRAELDALTDRLRALLETPAFKARLWQFVSDVSVGKLVLPSEDDYLLAWVLCGMWANELAEHIASLHGLSMDEARAKTAETIENQRRMYGSLAATVDPRGVTG